MSTRNDDFDGYRKWLGITSKQRPPTHYDLLKISLDEDDDELIQAAAEQRRHYVDSKRGQGHDALIAEILMRIDEAEITLLNTEMRRDYDRQQELFEKRRKNRRGDPNAQRSRVKSRPGRTVGEDGGIVKTFAGIMVVVCVGFGGMAWFSFQMPWSKPAKQVEPVSVAQLPVAVPAQAAQVPAPVATANHSLDNGTLGDDLKPEKPAVPSFIEESSSAGRKRHLVRFTEPQALSRFICSNKDGKSWIENDELLISSQSQEFRGSGHTTYSTYFTKLDSVQFTARIIKPSRHEVRFAVGKLNGIISWAYAENEHHFRSDNGDHKFVSRPLIKPGEVFTVVVRQTQPNITKVMLNDELVYTTSLELDGAITLYSSKSDIAIQTLEIIGVPDLSRKITNTPKDFLW